MSWTDWRTDIAGFLINNWEILWNNFFKTSKVKQKHIWDAPLNFDNLFPSNPKFESHYKAISRDIEIFAGLEGVKRQNKNLTEIC